jgi:hypothetical protein
LIVPATAFVAPVIGRYLSVLIHRSPRRFTAEALTRLLFVACPRGLGEVEMVGWRPGTA